METINFGAADKPVVRYTPTMDLRFVRRKVKLDPFYQPNVAEVRVLQQRHIGSDGSTRWYDVPMIDEPVETPVTGSPEPPST